MSPSSITSLPPSLPSLSKRHSVEGFQIMMWQWNPSVDHFLKSIIKIVIWGNCILYIISVVCSLAENHSLFIGIAWGSNLRASSEYPSSPPGAAVGQTPRWEDTVTTCNRQVKLGIDPQPSFWLILWIRTSCCGFKFVTGGRLDANGAARDQNTETEQRANRCNVLQVGCGAAARWNTKEIIRMYSRKHFPAINHKNWMNNNCNCANNKGLLFTKWKWSTVHRSAWKRKTR